MKKLLLLITIIIGLTPFSNAQSISPVNFLRFFYLANNDDAVRNIDIGLKSLSKDWKLEGGEEGTNRYTMTWTYTLPYATNPSSEFYLTTIRVDGKLYHKLSYLFMNEGLYQRYYYSVRVLDGTKVTSQKITEDGALITVYENPQTTFTFHKGPRLSTVGDQVIRTYTVEVYYTP